MGIDAPHKSRDANDPPPLQPSGGPSGSETQPTDEQDVAAQRHGTEEPRDPSRNVPIDPTTGGGGDSPT